MDTQLEVLAELLPELCVVLLVLADVRDHFQDLLHEVLLDHLEDLVLLQRLTRDVERQILGVDNTLDEAVVLRDEVLAVVHDENTAHVQLDVVKLLLWLEHVKRSTLGAEDESLELKLALNGKVLDSKVLLPVVGKALVEGAILLLGDPM